MDVFILFLLFVLALIVTFMWMGIATRAAEALEGIARTRNVEVMEPFLRKHMEFSEGDFQEFLKNRDPAGGFDPEGVVNEFLRWKLQSHARELRPVVLPETAAETAVPDMEDLEALSVTELKEIIHHPSDYLAETVEAAHRILAERG